ncbi:endonuclease/exonuclease/phosphatase family protein [Pedobacter steynii]|uniref:endonuclease/exonuclease/phosphatase family protein n=1 Tax=Pedobacter steynii TaxID=430522 RepID=UPI001FDF7CFB|nr:endonuclease/exonuclease/phosphatase family protein [Pedobacter steynii]
MKQRLLILFFLVVNLSAIAQGRLSIVSWNLKDMGKSKSDAVIEIIAKTLSAYDIVAIQEIVAGPGGAQAVARLADELNRKGTKWEYEVSEVTSGYSAYKAERYAFLWKSARVSRVGKGWLERQYGSEIEREPFYGRFRLGRQNLTLVNYHAITKSQQPEREVKYFKFLPALYPDDQLVFCGDFNLPQSHSVFNPLRSMGYIPVLIRQKTTLRQRCLNEDCLASEFDNFYFRPAGIRLKVAGVIHFYRLLPDLAQSRKVSDHIPIFAVYEL